MAVTSVQELRRIAEAAGQLRGHRVADVEIRADCRLMRIRLDEGEILLVSVLLDEQGKPRLDVDFLRVEDVAVHGQLEVRFDAEERLLGHG
jgi:hypothetical protein